MERFDLLTCLLACRLLDRPSRLPPVSRGSTPPEDSSPRPFLDEVSFEVLPFRFPGVFLSAMHGADAMWREGYGIEDGIFN